MVQANYGYEKFVSGGVIKLRIRRNRSVFVASMWGFAFVMSVVLMLIGTQINNGRGGPPPEIFPLICVGLFGIAILCSFGRRYTVVTMGPDSLSLDTGNYAKGDIGQVQICEPGTRAFTYSSQADYNAKMAYRNAVASQNHYVTFVYGSSAVLLAGKLTALQADHVGSEIVDWLAA